MVKVEGLYYSYTNDDKYAVKDISFEIAEGESFGLLGPSGAGKSTTQNILTGLLPLKTGEVQVAGYDMHHPKREMFNKLGVSFEQSNVYGKLTALENLEFYRKLFDVPTLDPMELLTLVGLEQVATKKAATFSKGMKHRLTFVRSMLNQPILWFLDEPTTGLDPAIASVIKDIVKEKKERGTTIFLTTHNMFLADELCDRVGFIVDGELRLIDSPRNLKLKYGEKLVEVEYVEEAVKANQAIAAAQPIVSDSADGSGTGTVGRATIGGGTGTGAHLVRRHFSLVDPVEVAALQEVLATRKIETMHTKEATLEEIFIKVTGRKLV
ncbi:MAG: ATP-binding cassette domain-containing protein [Acidaminobacter sp.]|uniref:ABC transporter ATP-binding protein n=1 Tax=Acidaminobacter sp. TaxID=1872102 RepID=UPI00137E5A06|nr:ABC transporter ATP-binding protein [Acidaminobacter sp.]MZQ98731.1 ATP-binding cassette domain-containing protein [Acidaminobacter sp.]